ncbi:MAG: hypothetical protein ACLGI5_19480 [Thermoleophilia bacterium]
MSQRQRLLLSAAAAAIVVIAFVALRPGDSDNNATAPTTPAPPVTIAAPPPVATTAEPSPPPVPRPAYVQIRAKGSQPVGGIKKITVRKGDTVRFEVRSDQADEGHLHGYDISKPVGPGKRARYMFNAKLEGIFELELENAGVPIAELQVNP